MTAGYVRIHLAQALTRAENPDARAHVRAALDAYDNPDHSAKTPDDVWLNQIEMAETELEAWLVRHAMAGIPEIVLSGTLRDYADRIDELGHVPRSWAALEDYRTVSSSEKRPTDDPTDATERGDIE